MKFFPSHQKLISQKMIGDFEELFVVDCEQPPSEDFTVQLSYQWNLDDVTDSELAKAIAIKIASLVAQDLKEGTERLVRVKRLGNLR